MAKNISKTAPVTVRSVKEAVERTQLYIKMLSRKSGITAQAMADAVGATTRHNSWSLTRLAQTYGYTLWTDVNEKDGLMRYGFTKIEPKAPKAAKIVKAAKAPKTIAAKAEPTAEAAVAAKIAAPAKKTAKA